MELNDKIKILIEIFNKRRITKFGFEWFYDGYKLKNGEVVNVSWRWDMNKKIEILIKIFNYRGFRYSLFIETYALDNGETVVAIWY